MQSKVLDISDGEIIWSKTSDRKDYEPSGIIFTCQEFNDRCCIVFDSYVMTDKTFELESNGVCYNEVFIDNTLNECDLKIEFEGIFNYELTNLKCLPINKTPYCKPQNYNERPYLKCNPIGDRLICHLWLGHPYNVMNHYL